VNVEVVVAVGIIWLLSSLHVGILLGRAFALGDAQRPLSGRHHAWPGRLALPERGVDEPGSLPVPAHPGPVRDSYLSG
jgi:hypothetical protein